MIFRSTDCLFPQLFTNEITETLNPVLTNFNTFKTSIKFDEGKFTESEEKYELKKELMKLNSLKVIILCKLEKKLFSKE